MLASLLEGILTFLVRWIFNPLVHFVFRWILGWKIEGELPDVPKMICAFSPHTTNADFFFIVYVASYFGVRPNWIGKKELFEGPFGRFSYYTGGIPVDRDKPLKATKQIIKYIRNNEQFILCIAPEGTRHYVDHWKKGFYFIAQKTELPIVFFKVDYKTRQVTVRDAFYPTGDMDADLEIIKPFFDDAVGRHPERAAPIRFADEI